MVTMGFTVPRAVFRGSQVSYCYCCHCCYGIIRKLKLGVPGQVKRLPSRDTCPTEGWNDLFTPSTSWEGRRLVKGKTGLLSVEGFPELSTHIEAISTGQPSAYPLPEDHRMWSWIFCAVQKWFLHPSSIAPPPTGPVPGMQ